MTIFYVERFMKREKQKKICGRRGKNEREGNLAGREYYSIIPMAYILFQHFCMHIYVYV